MPESTPTIQVDVDVSNPGQFFACCGLLELADRLWPGAEGWFDSVNPKFNLRVPDSGNKHASKVLVDAISATEIISSMTDEQRSRRTELTAELRELRKQINGANGAFEKRIQLLIESYEQEKKRLDKLWRESPVALKAPFKLTVDWYLDEFSGGSKFKTWAGQQSVIDIAQSMREATVKGNWRSVKSENWLQHPSESKCVPFNFDSDLGPQASSIDVGYSLDALGMATQMRPMIELLAFVGLQRFRPKANTNAFLYQSWSLPLPPEIAAPIVCMAVPEKTATTFEFTLLYRTKYLKSFLPATQTGVL